MGLNGDMGRTMLEQLAFDQMDIASDDRAKPVAVYRKAFLKWAGGKYKVLPRIFAALPPGSRLIEPFAGSAVVSLNADYPRRLAADSNRDLINLYRSITVDVAKFINETENLFVEACNTRESFEGLRSEFNASDDPFRRSVLFVYLNRHCFNGLCRYNAKGAFNVPFGRYRSPTLPRREIEFFASRAASIQFEHGSFEAVMSEARPGDVVYCDPPYAPLSITANFTGYTDGIFGEREQRRLASLARDLQSRGIPVVISNHDTPFTRSLYEGARIQSFGVQRNISCDGYNRGQAPELLAVFA
jgi:DNA adenine methylase